MKQQEHTLSEKSEIENLELAQKRMKELYKAKGYSDARNTATTVFLHRNEVVSSFLANG